MATTLVISDLHLGGRGGTDVLRKPEVRATLLAALRGVDRLVLLGDVLELRHGPIGEALRASEHFFREIGETMAGREVVLVAGNHDHQLIVPWLERRARAHVPRRLGLEQWVAPARASWAAAQMAAWLGDASTTVAYPGLWLRDDVYAALGRAGAGRLSADRTGPELRRAMLRAMGEVVRRLGIEAEHVIFGHSHRAGPLPDDELDEWTASTGTRLHNSGCWVYEQLFVARAAGESPYWPGAAIRVVDDAPPALERLLADLSAEDLAA